jgi:hypothetical protein
MAPWNVKQHAINSIMWATVGAYVSQNYLQEIPMPLKLAGLAVVYSYATDYIDSMLA